jgi:hypothetical protein
MQMELTFLAVVLVGYLCLVLLLDSLIFVVSRLGFGPLCLSRIASFHHLQTSTMISCAAGDMNQSLRRISQLLLDESQLRDRRSSVGSRRS